MFRLYTPCCLRCHYAIIIVDNIISPLAPHAALPFQLLLTLDIVSAAGYIMIALATLPYATLMFRAPLRFIQRTLMLFLSSPLIRSARHRHYFRR